MVTGKFLFTNPGKTVSEAAFESGFKNISHFSRCFKERFGINPVAARITPLPEHHSKITGLLSKAIFTVCQ